MGTSIRWLPIRGWDLPELDGFQIHDAPKLARMDARFDRLCHQFQNGLWMAHPADSPIR